MDPILKTGLTLTFIGLVILTVGYSYRDFRYGPPLMWVGVATMIGVIVFYVMRKLGG